MSVKKKVETPDGRTLNIEAPDDATDDEVIEFVESELQKEEINRERAKLQATIDGQNKALDILTEDVLNMAKLMLKLTDRLDAIDKRKMPNVNMTPNIHVNPEVKVATDPAITEMMREMGRAHDDTLKQIIESLTKLGEVMTKSQVTDRGELEFQVIPVHDQRSGRYGRIDKIRVVKAE